MPADFTVTPTTAPPGSNVVLTVVPGSTFGTAAGRVHLRTSSGDVDLTVVGAWLPATLTVTLPEKVTAGAATIVVETEPGVLGTSKREQGSAPIQITGGSMDPGTGTGTGSGKQLLGNLLGPLGEVLANEIRRVPVLAGFTVPTGPDEEPPAPSGAGKYRATIVRIACHRETWDHLFEADGKRDEVYVFAAGATVGLTPQGVSNLDLRETTTPVYGDTNNQSGRIQAGSASDRGGIRTGDAFDVDIPIWDGDLTATEVGVVVPTIWEWDGDPAQIRLSWQNIATAQVQGLAAAVTGAVGALPSTPLPLSTPLAQVTVPDVLRDTAPGSTGPVGQALPGPFVDSELPGWFGVARNRPVGFQRNGDREAFYPKALVLTAAAADPLTRTDLGHGPGVVEVRYTDREDLKGDYSLFVRIERI